MVADDSLASTRLTGYTQAASYPNGFFVVDKGAINEDTKKRIEAQGYMVIEKVAGRSVEVLHMPRQQIQHYPNPQYYPYYSVQRPIAPQGWQNS